MKTFALLGKSLSHSFSKKYFDDKFKKEELDKYNYINIETDNIKNIKEIIKNYNLNGFNVTNPYKKDIIKYLDKIDNTAKEINSVNTVKILNNKLFGYNTDLYGFKQSFLPLIKKRKKALILGNGGVSKTIQYVLKSLNIKIKIISRNDKIKYSDLTKEIMNNHLIIINCTPLGTFPNIEEYPKIPYKHLNKKHLLYDVVYNPEETKFLKLGKKYKSEIKNGLQMLEIQAEESWKIWNSQNITCNLN